MIALMPNALRTKYIVRDTVEEWVDESGRLVLMGEAAHPMLVSYARISRQAQRLTLALNSLRACTALA